MSKITPLQESLLVFQSLLNYLQLSLAISFRKDRLDDEDLKFIMQSWIVLQLSSFLDELNIFSHCAKNDDAVRQTLRKIKPYVSRITIWRGIEKIRSRLIAHGFREKNGRFISAPKVFAQYDAPTRYAETFLLAYCAINAIEIILKRFKEEFKDAAAKEKSSDTPVEAKGIKSLDQIKSELKKLEVEVSRII